MAFTTTSTRRGLAVASLATSCVLGLVLSPSAAHADPTADKTAVQAEIVKTQHEIETVAEEYNDAKIKLEQLTAAKTAAEAAAGQATASLGDEQDRVAQTGVNLYKGPALAEATTLMTGGSPQEIIDKLSTLAQISEHYGQSLEDLQNGQSQAAAAQAQAEQAAAAAAATEQQIAAKKAQIESKLPDLEAKLAALTEEERQAVLAQAGGHATDESAAPESSASSESTAAASSSAAPSTKSSTKSSTATQAPAASAGTGGSSAAQGAVQAALTRLGKPYVWGAAGPNSFDCSGLTMWAYAQVGISLPHSSSAQASSGTTVSLSALAPGDILWMPGHVGMYIGNGQVVHAPTTGDVVKVVSLSSMSWSKGVRVA